MSNNLEKSALAVFELLHKEKTVPMGDFYSEISNKSTLRWLVFSNSLHNFVEALISEGDITITEQGYQLTCAGKQELTHLRSKCEMA